MCHLYSLRKYGIVPQLLGALLAESPAPSLLFCICLWRRETLQSNSLPIVSIASMIVLYALKTLPLPVWNNSGGSIHLHISSMVTWHTLGVNSAQLWSNNNGSFSSMGSYPTCAFWYTDMIIRVQFSEWELLVKRKPWLFRCWENVSLICSEIG
jgi:hypothetical protein